MFYSTSILPALKSFSVIISEYQSLIYMQFFSYFKGLTQSFLKSVRSSACISDLFRNFYSGTT